VILLAGSFAGAVMAALFLFSLSGPLSEPLPENCHVQAKRLSLLGGRRMISNNSYNLTFLLAAIAVVEIPIVSPELQ